MMRSATPPDDHRAATQVPRNPGHPPDGTTDGMTDDVLNRPEPPSAKVVTALLRKARSAAPAVHVGQHRHVAPCVRPSVEPVRALARRSSTATAATRWDHAQLSIPLVSDPAEFWNPTWL